ncbi:molybdopterin synthase sulfur carrier subunit [Microbacterium sp. Root61]|uniref:MoaD/ThiS family protein n=1 Tax=Microbacterium sp. Root61 TaxID=1736570 RepID=UPI0006F7F31E|nr:MoaD/ThiS family protein [Microbacterium sp. Root61]KRA24232.1 molybdopterin synthase sulfur carrier subunit [Microbacterium sp. Root61]
MARVRYFAAAREAAGVEEENRGETTLGQLRVALGSDYPELGGILPRCAVLVGGARLEDDAVLDTDVLVDVLPPFAGG